MISHRTRGIYHLTLLAQCLALAVGYWLWLLLYHARIPLTPEAVEQYLLYLEFLLLGILVGSSFSKASSNFINPNFVTTSRHTLRQVGFALFYLLIFLVALGDRNISRMFLFSFVPILYVTLFLLNHYLPPRIASWIFTNGREERILLVGRGEKARALQQWLQRKRRLGLSVVGVLDDDPAGPDGTIPVLGRLSQLETVLEQHRINQVVLTEFPDQCHQLPEYTALCERKGIRLLVVSDLDSQFQHPVTIFEDDGVCFIGLREEPLESPFNRLLKRALDIAVALPVVLFVLPATTLLVWWLHRRQSPGPLFFVQTRAGLQNRPFHIYKYRTMHVGHGRETQQAVPDDPRVFPAGRWLRKLSLDELPQFWNVLRGEMSVVGPRPHLLQHNEIFARALGNYQVRAFVKPGITGLAQVQGFRGETRNERDVSNRVGADLRYLENWSLSLDCWLILRTGSQMLAPPRTAV